MLIQKSFNYHQAQGNKPFEVRNGSFSTIPVCFMISASNFICGLSSQKTFLGFTSFVNDRNTSKIHQTVPNTLLNILLSDYFEGGDKC